MSLFISYVPWRPPPGLLAISPCLWEALLCTESPEAGEEQESPDAGVGVAPVEDVLLRGRRRSRTTAQLPVVQERRGQASGGRPGGAPAGGQNLQENELVLKY